MGKQSKKELVIQKDVLYCTCVGKKMRPSGQTWADYVKSSKVVNGQLLLYFKNNNFTCDNRTCILVKESDSE